MSNPAVRTRAKSADSSGPLPGFLVIGAVKAGTTSMHMYLDAHPEVFVPAIKEVHFFNRNWERGPGWYRQHFAEADGAAAVGEVCPGYALYPFRPHVPGRVAALIPQVRLVYVVRHPVDRIVSQYRHQILAGKERRPIDDAVLSEPRYLDASRYAFQLDQYLPHFPPEQILVVTDQQLERDRRGALSRIYGWVGADPAWWSDDLADLRANATGGKRPLRGPGRTLKRLPGARTAARLLPASVTHRPPKEIPAELSPRLRDELEARLRDDVGRLRPYVGSDFDGWGIG